METSDETLWWLCKVNPKFVPFLERLLIIMEQTQMLPRQEEKSRPIESVPETLLTVLEAAQRLRVSEYTLRGWISQRRIPYVKIGRRTLFNPADLDNLIKDSTVEPRKPRGEDPLNPRKPGQIVLWPPVASRTSTFRLSLSWPCPDNTGLEGGEVLPFGEG